MTNKPHMLGILYETTDVITLARFYRDTFEFKPNGKLHPEWTVLTSGNCQLAIKKISVSKKLLNFLKQKTNNSQLMIAVQDVENTRIQLSKAGVKVNELQFYGSHCFCSGQDPAGNRFQLTSASSYYPKLIPPIKKPDNHPVSVLYP